MSDELLSLDTALFRAINGNRSPFADCFFSVFSAHITIGIVVALICLYVMYKHRFKHWYVYIIVVGLCFLFADRISVMCFKDVFCRLRPSHALSDAVTVKLKHYSYLIYDNKGGLYGFVSSHAANTFTIITTMILILRHRLKNYQFVPTVENVEKQENQTQIIKREKRSFVIFSVIMIVWGILTGISRVYCGYHYPGDVLCGALLGILLGIVVFMIYKWIINKLDGRLTTTIS